MVLHFKRLGLDQDRQLCKIVPYHLDIGCLLNIVPRVRGKKGYVALRPRCFQWWNAVRVCGLSESLQQVTNTRMLGKYRGLGHDNFLPPFRALASRNLHRRNRVSFAHNVLRGPGALSRYSESLRDGRYGDRISVGARFSAPVQTCPRAHPASYTVGTGSFPGVKGPERGIDHPPHLAPRLRKE